MAGFIDRSQWKTFLDEFSKRNQLRPTRLEVVGDIGAQEQEVFLPFVGVSIDTKGDGSIDIALGGETAAEERQLTHHISNVERIAYHWYHGRGGRVRNRRSGWCQNL